ncbi:MAG TPA: hypothetical protein VN690_00685 [Terriglobales bacterium]|nr:hypothetical protein [Terriglobales bacterium]
MPETINAIALLGWMEEVEALRFLCQNCAGSEQRNEDTARSVWLRARRRVRAAIANRAYVPARATTIDNEGTREFLKCAGTYATGVVAVDPASLIAHQFVVSGDRAIEHLAANSSWAERCLQLERPSRALPVAHERNSIIFDVPHGEHVLALTPGGELRIEQLPACAMVVPVGDGYMLRAGYHRAYAYMRADPAPVEPFLAGLSPYGLVELEDPALRDKILSRRPPLVGDYIESAFSANFQVLKKRFRFKITADLDVVPMG